MLPHTVVLFGESEKGEYHTAYFCHTLSQLMQNLGNPPDGSRGLYFAVQALMFKRSLLYFRVKEEGFSTDEYFQGLKLLKNQELIPNLIALCLPGVGDSEIINEGSSICESYNSVLVTTEADLYDYLTESSF